MAAEGIFQDSQGRQITYHDLCSNILRIAPMRVANSIMGLPNINMFAKYKPVRRSAPNYVRHTDYWKGDDGKCGIDIPFVPRLEEILNYNWSYARPRSGMGSNEPAILSDFYYYGRHNDSAIPFVTPYPFAYSYEYKSGAPFTVFFSNMTENAAGDDNLKMSDVPFLADKYLAICIGRLAHERVITSVGTIGQGYNSVTVSAEWMNTAVGMGTHNIHHFLTTERQWEGSQAPVVDIYPVYHDAKHPNPQTVNVMPYSAPIEFTRITQYATGWKGKLLNIEDTHVDFPPYKPLLIFFPITAVNKKEYSFTQTHPIYVDVTCDIAPLHTSPLNYLYDSDWNGVSHMLVPANSEKTYYLGVDISYLPYDGNVHMTYFSFRFAEAGGFGNCQVNFQYT